MKLYMQINSQERVSSFISWMRFPGEPGLSYKVFQECVWRRGRDFLKFIYGLHYQSTNVYLKTFFLTIISNTHWLVRTTSIPRDSIIQMLSIPTTVKRPGGTLEGKSIRKHIPKEFLKLDPIFRVFNLFMCSPHLFQNKIPEQA